MSKFPLFLRNLPWIGRIQAAGIVLLLVLSLLVGYSAVRIQRATRQFRAQLDVQTQIHDATELLQKTLLREHLALLESDVSHDRALFPMRQNLRNRAFREMTQLLSMTTNSPMRIVVELMSDDVRAYFQALDRIPSVDIQELTRNLRHIERLGEHVLATDDALMEQGREQFRSSLTLERHITLWAGGALVGMLVMALWYGLSLVRPISELLQAISRIKKGDFDFQIPVRRKDDMGRLADSFNGMIRNVNLQQQRLIQESVTDGLTGLYNTKHFWTSLRAVAEETYGTDRAFSLLMIDIDHFKQFNDRHGHEFGNAVIKMAASIIKQNLRTSDILARYGGDEFVAILPDTTAEEGLELAHRIEAAAAALYFPSQKTGALSALTLSIGGATFAQTHTSLEVLICRTDNALYAAKNSGRACVRWAEEYTEKNEAVESRRLVS